MGRLIVFFIGVVVLVIIASLVAIYFRRKRSQETAREKGWAIKGDLNRLQEHNIIQINDQAAEIFHSLVSPPTDLYDSDATLLSRRHRTQIESWLRSRSTIKMN